MDLLRFLISASKKTQNKYLKISKTIKIENK